MGEWSLGGLADPANFQGALDVSGSDAEQLLQSLEMMFRIRWAERYLANGRRDGLKQK